MHFPIKVALCTHSKFSILPTSYYAAVLSPTMIWALKAVASCCWPNTLVCSAELMSALLRINVKNTWKSTHPIVWHCIWALFCETTVSVHACLVKLWHRIFNKTRNKILKNAHEVCRVQHRLQLRTVGAHFPSQAILTHSQESRRCSMCCMAQMQGRKITRHYYIIRL